MLSALVLALVAAPPAFPARSTDELEARAKELVARYHESKDPRKRREHLEEIAALTEPGSLDPAVARALAAGLSDENHGLRRTTLLLLRDEHPGERRAALLAAAVRLPREISDLREKTEESSNLLVQASADESGQRGNEILERLLAAAAYAVRWGEMCLYAGGFCADLAELRDPASVGHLQALLGALETAPGVERCLEGLCLLGTRPVAEAVIGWLDVRRRALERGAERRKELSRARPTRGSPRGMGEAEWIERQKQFLAGMKSSAETETKRVQALGKTVCGWLDELARTRSLPTPPRSPDDAKRWTRWWEENRAALPETLDG